jgi:CP family cyanate transporter-like MFS transporter
VISSALTALNLGQIPASFLLLAVASKVERRVWPFIASAVITLAALLGVVMTASEWTILFAGLLGFILAIPFALGLALPAFLLPPEDIGRTAAAMFAIGYAWAMAASVASGAAWDFAGDPRFAFLPIALSVLPLIALVPTIRMSRQPAT